MKTNTIVMGIDIGGTHITTGMVNLEARAFIKGTEARRMINSKGTAEEIIKGWVNAIHESKASIAGAELMGIAIPGPFDYCSGISMMEDNHKYGSLYKVNVKQALAEALGIDNDCIRFRNDAEAFLHGEVFCGAGVSCKRVVGITLGTGLGSAWYVNGKCADVELWKSEFKEGIAEDYLSSRWFVNRYHELTDTKVGGVKYLSQIAQYDLSARQVFHEFSCNLAAFLTPIIKNEQPELIIIGGNISNTFPLFRRELFSRLPTGTKSSIKQFQLGEHAALIGAACLWENDINVPA